MGAYFLLEQRGEVLRLGEHQLVPEATAWLSSRRDVVGGGRNLRSLSQAP